MNLKWGQDKEYNGKYDRFTTVTNTTNGRRYSIHYNNGYIINDDGEYELLYTEMQVSPITPYDLQEYAWAYYNEDDDVVKIIRGSKVLFKKPIEGLCSFYNETEEELNNFANEDDEEFLSMYDDWFCGVVEKIISLLEQENKKYDRMMDRT
jgi:hypothetical protein